jgi:hypothetical protein
MKSKILLLILLILTFRSAFSQDFNAYDMGSPTLQDIYVSTSGNDGNSGTSPAQALQTISAAWAMIPNGTLTTTGYRINLMPGTFPCEGDCINFFSDKTGTYNFPIIIRAYNGPGTVTLLGGLNLMNLQYVYLTDLSLWAGEEAGAAFGNDVLHLELGSHILMRNLTITGPVICIADTCNSMQEVLKVNQSEYIYIENCDLSGTYQTVLDFFSVQHGHIFGNKIHRSGGRGMYLKGGSAYFLVQGNEVYDCREAGIQMGEGSNLAFMRTPWLHYESYDTKVVNNFVHDIYGAGLSIVGSYNVLMAYNTCYRIGLDSYGGGTWSLFQLVHGYRGCYSASEFGGDAGTHTQCQSLLDLGGWGTSALGDSNSGAWIPNQNVYVYNNIFYNPAGSTTHYVQFVANGEINPPAQTQNIPNPSRTDNNVYVKGNIIWNFPQEYQGMVGSNDGSSPACQPASTCDTALLMTLNHINQFEPEFVNVAGNDFHPLPLGNIYTATAYTIPSFTWSDIPPAPIVPAGTLTNTITIDYDSKIRTGIIPPGAYSTSTAGISKPEENQTFTASISPNPFLEKAELKLNLQQAGNIKIELLDLLGRSIKVLKNEYRPAGKYSITLNANSVNASLAGGHIYLCSIQFNNQVPLILKVVVLK